MPKSSKRFTLHTDSLNSQGFRMLTDGCDLSDFEKNPVMLFNHIRPEGNQRSQILPIGYWTDIELNDGKISAVPFFDDKDDFAMSIYNKVEAGVIKMASVGAEPTTTSKAKELLVEGQKLETVTEWKMKEASICDIGSNPDALAVALYDSNNGKITLSESNISTIQNQTMATKKSAVPAPPKNKKAVKLADDPEKELADDDPEKALADDEGDEKDKEIASLKAKLKELESKLSEAEEKMKLTEGEEDDPEEKATKLADAALKLKKITLKEKAAVIKLAVADYDSTVEMLKARKAHVSVKETLETKPDIDESRVVELSKKSFDELFTSKTSDLEFLKLNAPDVFKAKYKAKFGKEPKNV